MSLDSGPLSGRKYQMDGRPLPSPDWAALEAACDTGNDVRDELRKVELRAVLSIPTVSERDRHGYRLAAEWQ